MPSDLLTKERFERFFEIASGLDFDSSSHDDLADWRAGHGSLPERPIMFAFDHPDWSIRDVVWPMMEDVGYRDALSQP